MKILLISTFVFLAICCGGLGAVSAEDAKREFFESKIRPVLVKHCYRCHSAKSGKSKGGLHLDSRVGWQVGGDSGPAIVPHKPNKSLVFLAISHSGETSEMPPPTRLAPAVVSDFKTWIAGGAVDPREGKSPAAEVRTMDIEEGRKVWAFQPRQTYSPQHSIDDFIHPQAPVAAADKLVRRLFLDVVGLPPTQTERSDFVRMYNEQSAAEAVTYFTDQLLSRRQFGEKWARHWLDVARYADSNGGDFNLTFPEAWRYRNYVIDAFNNDMPYDQFLREQIAGDLLPADVPQQRNRQLIATGFLMVAAKMLTERNKPKMHLDIADEQLDTIGRSVMGLTLGCARCHDHKFDPIPTADYYAMLGILHSTRTADGILMNNVNVSGWAETDLAIDEETKSAMAVHQVKVATLKTQIEQKKKMNDAANTGAIVVDDTKAELSGSWRKSTLRPNHIGKNYLVADKNKGPFSIRWKATLPKPGLYEVRVSFGGGGGLAKEAAYAIRHATGETRLVINQTVQPTIQGLWFPLGQFTFGSADTATTAEVVLSGEDAAAPVIADAIQLIHVDDLAKNADTGAPLSTEINALEAELKKLNGSAFEIPKAMAAKDHTDKRLGDLRIRIRGETKNLGDAAPRGFLQVASTAISATAAIPDKQSGRRQLAEWLTHREHPLTARVLVNRIWQQLFGRGIVSTSDNFGSRGALPTHPELLDHLAESLIANDWSMKRLIREIISSQTYQQSVQAAADDDPNNLLVRSQNRRPASAETLRDSILAIAGELDAAPRQSVVEQLGMYAISSSGSRHKSLAETGKLRQRSIYMPVVRGAVPPSLAVFDMPNPDLVTGTRAATTVPAQALFMLNSPFVREMAEAVSSRTVKTETSNKDIVQQLYQQILIRDADDDDINMGIDFIARSINTENASRQEAVASLVQILFSSTEFRFIE